MNLNSIAAPLVSAINPREMIKVYPSTGYTTNADGTRTPTYGTPIPQLASIQALEQSDIYMAQGLDLSKETCSAYLYGNPSGVVRADNKGGDLVVRADGTNWLITMVFENWQGSTGWTKVALTRQLDS